MPEAPTLPLDIVTAANRFRIGDEVKVMQDGDKPWTGDWLGTVGIVCGIITKAMPHEPPIVDIWLLHDVDQVSTGFGSDDLLHANRDGEAFHAHT